MYDALKHDVNGDLAGSSGRSISAEIIVIDGCNDEIIAVPPSWNDILA